MNKDKNKDSNGKTEYDETVLISKISKEALRRLILNTMVLEAIDLI